VESALAVARLLASQGVGELIVADDEDPRRTKIAGRIPNDGSAGWNDAQWREVVTTLNTVAGALRDALGMRVVVHHHAGTFVETPAEIERLLAETACSSTPAMPPTEGATRSRSPPATPVASVTST
jgi:inosose dehydratase